MPKNSMQKQKLLYLQKIMLEKTDESHGLSINEIIAELARYGIHSERKSLYDDLRILENFGLDICSTRGRYARYYVASRDFEMPELKLLVDAVQCSKFITKKKSLLLIEKLKKLAGAGAGELSRQIYLNDRNKNANEKIYYNVNDIQTAVSKNKQIKFFYYKWDISFGSAEKIVKRKKRSAAYRVSPWALRWDDENYYLIAYDRDAEIIKHFRVDKMGAVEITDEDREGKECFDRLNAGLYTKSVFSMFGGKETAVTLLVDNSLVGVIADRFGPDVFIAKESDGAFRAEVAVVLSRQFYAWLLGFGGKAKIVSPDYAADEYVSWLKSALEAYDLPRAEKHTAG